MIDVNKAFKICLLLLAVVTVLNAALKYKDYARFMSVKTDELYFSNNLEFMSDGGVLFIAGYHKFNYSLFFYLKKDTSQILYDENNNNYIYFTDFHSDNHMQLSELFLVRGEKIDKNVSDDENHALRYLNNEILQIIYQSKKVICYTKVLKGSVKCIIRRK